MSGLKSWALWFALIGGAALLVGIAFWLSWIDPRFHGLVERTMYLAMGVIATTLIVTQARVMLMLDRETQRAIDIAQRVVAPAIRADDEAGAATPHHLRRSIEQLHFEGEEDAVPRGMNRHYFARHLKNLLEMSRTRSLKADGPAAAVSQDTLIEILHERLSAENRFIELFSSVLVTLGLIGTILGLMLMMSSLTDVMQAQGAGDGLLQALAASDGPLSGLGVAFMTTLIGAVLGGVVLRVLTAVVERHITDYVAEVAELTDIHVIGRL